MQKKLITIKLELIPEEAERLAEVLRDSLYYIQDLDDRNHHPGDLVEWGKQLQLTGTLLLKIKEASNGDSKNSKKKK